MEEILFYEKQKYHQRWLWYLILFFSIGFIALDGIGLYVQLVLKEPFGNRPASDTALIIISVVTFLFVIALIWVFRSACMETKITRDGIHYKYKPFINKYKKINFSSIKHYEVRKYKPIEEYGGWGLRVSIFKKNRAYNVHGDIGLQLVLNDDSRILLGTQEPEKINAALETVFHKVW